MRSSRPASTLGSGLAVIMAVALPGLAEAAAARQSVAFVRPPPRPAALSRDVEATGSIAARPVQLAAADDDQPIEIAQAQAGGTDRSIVERANAALNALTSMTADFSQVGGDGRRLNGTLYVQRPGKLRFEYNKPSTMEVVSDGSTVLVRDRKLNTSDPYPIGQTPLKFLTAGKTDLARQARLISAGQDGEGARIAIEDSTTLGGTSRITLTFDPEIKVLKRWRVVDPQGYTTTVTLSDIETNRTIDPRIFMLNYMRPVE